MKKTTLIALKAGAAPFALGLAMISTAASAQTAAVDCAANPNDASCKDDGRGIVVTGSIVRNPSAATASPIVSVTADDLVKRGITTTAEALQSLTANNAGTVPPSWSAFGFTTGASTPSLRGFNDAYTLVLFDGMRTAPYPLADDTQRTIVDINTIPSSIVSSIDVLLDGASATYGSDAIAGVVNILVKHQITGFHANASGGISQRGDAGEQRISASYGFGDLDDQGFNIYVNGEYSRGDPVFLRQRGAPFNTADQSSICGTAAQGCLSNNIRNGIQYNGAYNGFQSTTVPFVRPYTPGLVPLSLGGYQLLDPAAGCQDLNPVTLTAAQRAGTVTPAVVCQQDRVNQFRMYNSEISRRGGTIRGTAKLGDNAEAYLMFNFYETKTQSSSSNLGYVGATADGGPTVTVNRIFLPAYVCAAGTSTITATGDLIALGCNAGNGTLNPNNPFAAAGNSARLVAAPILPTASSTDAKTYRIAAGINGSISDGFNYTLGATYSKVDLDVTNTGYIYLQGLMDAVARGTFNFVNPSANSPAANQLVFPDRSKRSGSKLAQVQATLDKDMFELPGGMLNVAIAGQFRHESIDNPSSNAPNAANPNARYFGINAVGVQGARDVWSAAYEISVPVLDMLRFKADGSYNHYSTGQKNFSPKFEAEFKPIEQLKLRGTFSKGFRAPNFSESFNLPATGFISAQISCASPIYASFCAAHASNPSYYSGGYSVGLTSSGNPNLKSEKSTSYTFGTVIQPIRNVTLTLDYWHTKITNVIVAASTTSDLYDQYYNGNGVVNIPGVTVTQGVADPQNPGALPLLGSVISSFKNANAFMGSGVDFTADWSLPLSGSTTWKAKASASYLIRLEQTNEDGSIWRFDGSLGGCNVTSCSGAPRFRASWQNTLDFNDVASLTLTANYTSSYSSVATDSGGVYGDCQASADNGQLVTFGNGDPVQCRSKAVFSLDGHVEVKATDKFTFYADVLNLLDTKASYDPNAAYGLYQFNPAWSDRLFIGRYFRVGAKVDF